MPEAAGRIAVPGQWGDLVVQAVLSDDIGDQPFYQMAVRAPGAGDGWDLVLSSDTYYTGSYRQTRRIVAALHDMQASDARWRTVVGSTPVMLWTIDRDGVFTMAEGQVLEKREVTGVLKVLQGGG